MTLRAPRPGLLVVAALTATLGAPGCHTGSQSKQEAASTAPSASAPTRRAARAAASASARSITAPPTLCRAVSLSGTVRLVPVDDASGAGGPPTPVVESSEVSYDAWIDMESDGKLTIRSGRSSRETTFSGPGRLRACVGRDEEMWLLQGKAESTSSAGERPGAEQWVVTAAGVIRYGGAKLRSRRPPRARGSSQGQRSR